MVRNRKYLPEYTFELLRLADSDLVSGHALIAAKVRLENACFHYQQAVEKSLKAVLVYKGVSFPSTHDLNLLLALLPIEVGECPNSHAIPELNIYGAQRRYEEGPTPATEEEPLWHPQWLAILSNGRKAFASPSSETQSR